jgi:hypothetical protein
MAGKWNVSGSDLILAGWQPERVLRAALAVAETLQLQGHNRNDILEKLDQVRKSPFDYENDPLYGTLAERLIQLEMRRARRR